MFFNLFLVFIIIVQFGCIVYLKRKKPSINSSLQDLSKIIENRIFMREGSLQKDLNAKRNMLNRVNSRIVVPTMMFVNDVTIMQDRISRPSCNIEEVKHLIDATLKNAIELYRYTRNILDVIKYEDGRFLLNIKMYDFKHFLDVIINAHQIKIKRQKAITFKYNAKKMGLEFDPFKIEQVFDNILTCILENTNDEVIIVEVSDKQINYLPKQSPGVLVSIKQSTMFIPEEKIEWLFNNPNETLDGELISKIIIEHHSGKIWVNKRNNELIFNILLPISNSISGTYTKPISANLINASVANSLRMEKIDLTSLMSEYELVRAEKGDIQKVRPVILFVDDDPSMQECASLIFPHMGYIVDISQSGEESIEKLNSQPSKYDVIIMDIIMNGINGIETIKLCKKITDEYEIPVILQSGYDNPEYVSNYKNYGASYFVKKPYSMEDIKSVVEKALKG